MNLSQYLKGRGVDVSRHPKLKNCKTYFVEPDNFYSLKKFAKPETLDFIYSKNLINDTKFFKILIKEWFYACRINGKIIIEMKSNKILSFNGLIKECKLLLGDKIIIIGKHIDNLDTGILILKKVKPASKKGDSIDKWTFGILTNGKRDDWVDQEIESILNLKIPHLEIIICGDYDNKKNYKINHIQFNPEIAWITKKKNIIAEKAKYENLVITHDRFIFDKDWFKGMKKYGNYFEVLSCVIKNSVGGRADDWMTYGTNLNDPLLLGNQGLLDYKDWDKNGYVDGGLYIMKKSVWKKIRWNNRLLWSQGEDIELSRDFYNNGFVVRFNPYSLCKTLSTKKYSLPSYEFNAKKLGKIKGQNILNKMKYFWKIKTRKHYLAVRDAWFAFKKYYPNQ